MTPSPDKFAALKKGLLLVGRFVLLFSVSWLITETLAQITQVPEFYLLKVWVFTYMVPVQLLFKGLLTMAGMAIDKMLHEIGKETGKDGWLGIKGLTGF